jgi:hypothetical protein
MTLLILYYTDRDQSDAASAAANPTISTQGGATNG